MNPENAEDDDGFLHPPLGDIEQIHALITEQYSTQSVLRELLQNADDAGARRIFLAIRPAAKQPLHALLSTPQLILANDGQFLRENADGIRSLRAGTKADSDSAIGKFGLGLKSVFHLCEAFLFAGASKATPEPIGHVLNPWRYERPEWRNVYGADKAALIENLRRWVANQWAGGLPPYWFALCLPLRTKEFLKGQPPILPNFPDEAELLSCDAVRELAWLLPGLRKVEEIEAKCSDGRTIRLRRSSGDSRFRMSDEFPGGLRELKGEIEIEVDGVLQSLVRWRGQEWAPREEKAVFEALVEHEKWPLRTTRRSDGSTERVKERAWPHAGVLFVTGEGIGNVSTQYAVFLPLSDSGKTSEIASRKDIRLLLHGTFFVDSSRRTLHSLEKDSVEGLWNRELLERGVLPQILPALASFVAEEQLPFTEAVELTRVLRRTPPIDSLPVALFGSGSWIPCWTPHGIEYRLIPLEAPYHRLGRSSQVDLFPYLSGLAMREAVMVADIPSLAGQEPAPWSGTLSDIGLTLDLRSVTSLRDLVDFLEENPTLATSDWDAVRKAFSSAFAEAGREGRLKNLALVHRALACLPRNRVVPMDAEKLDRVPGLWRDLARLSLNCLIVPDDVNQEGDEAPTALPPDAALSLLKWLADRLLDVVTETKVNSEPRWIAGVVGEVFKRLASQDRERPELRSVKAFHVQTLDSNQRTAFTVSLDELREVAKDHRLFSPRASDLDDVQEALPTVRLLRLLDNLPVNNNLPVLDIPGIQDGKLEGLAVLLDGSYPVANASGNRIKLLKRFVESNLRSISTYEACIRLLLHGQVQYAKDLTTPLVIPSRSEPIWAKLHRHLQQTLHRSWAILDPGIVRHLDDAQRDKLRLQEVGAASVEEQLRALNEEQLATLPIDDNEIPAVLAGIRDSSLWRRLPLHLIAPDTRTSLNAAVFLPGKVPVPGVLKPFAVILADPKGLQGRYQAEGVVPFDQDAIVRLGLANAEEEGVAEAILDALQEGASVRSEVATIEWLPRRDGGKVAPRSLLYLGDRRPEWAHVVAESPQFCLPSQLADPIRLHPGFPKLRAGALQGEEEATQLLNCLVRSPIFALPDLPLALLREVFGGDRLPGLEALRTLEEALSYSAQQIEDNLARLLFRPVGPSRTIELLAMLADSESPKGAIEVAAALMKTWDEDISLPAEMMLPNQAGSWKRADQLCAGTGRIAQEFCLHEKIAIPSKVSFEPIPLDASHRVEELNGKPSQLEENLTEVFAGWEEAGVRPQTIALLGVVLASTEGAGKFAATLLGSMGDVDAYRLRFLDDQPKPLKFAVVPRPLTPDQVVKSLVGSPLKVRTASELKYLFWRSCETDLETDVIQVPLWRLQASDGTLSLAAEKLTELLVAAIFSISDRFLGLSLSSRRALQSLIEDSREPEQVELKRIQEDLADRAFDYIETDLGRRGTNELRQLVQRWRDARRRRIEGLQHPEEIQRTRNLVRYEREARDLAEELIRVLQDPKQAGDVLRAIRTRLSESQYGADTIPFELFQNADDAALQLREMDPKHGACTISFRWRDDALTCVHTGRCINTYRMKGFSAEEGRRRGYDLDLEKMLRLGASGKGDSDGPVLTGRFGLGFKSVYLLTDRPELLSGRKSEAMAVALEAGLLPALLAPEAREKLDRLRSEQIHATVLRLPASPGKSVAEVMRRFERLASLQVLFSRTIRTCRIDSPSGRRDVRWNPTRLGIGIEIGESDGHRYLFLSAGVNRAGIAVACNGFGPEPLPDEVPTFWVTAPTQEKRRRGIAINGSFAIDIGRAQLAREDTENRKQIARMAPALGETLVKLFDELPACLRQENSPFVPDATPEQFWRQWWEVVSSAGTATWQADAEPADRLIHALLFGSHGAVVVLARECAAIPTGLFGRFDTLTAMSRIEGAVEGVLQKKEIFSEVAQWSSLRATSPGSLVSLQVAELLGKSVDRWNLAGCLENEIPKSGNIEPPLAARLGAVVPCALETCSPEEKATIREPLRRCRFKTRAGVWRDANAVVIPTTKYQEASSADEARRAGFAPPDWILHDDYLGDSDMLGFVFLCRDGRNFEAARRLLEWGSRATSPEAKAAYDAYRQTGDLAGRLNSLDPKSGSRENRDDDSASDPEDEEEDQEAGSDSPQPPVDPDFAERLEREWATNAIQLHAEWDRWLYPDDGAFFSLLDEEPETDAQRVAWLTLLVRGSLEAMGRSRYPQHYEFLRLCTEHRWLERMASRSREDRRLIVDDLEDWVRPSIHETTYYHWLRYLLPALLLAPRIEEYAFGLCALNRVTRFDPNLDLKAMRLGQARTDAPPLGPYLGIGAHFVLRELVRHEIVANEHVHTACFVPHRRFRQRFPISEGASHIDASRQLYDVVGRRTFSLGFDLALEENS